MIEIMMRTLRPQGTIDGAVVFPFLEHGHERAALLFMRGAVEAPELRVLLEPPKEFRARFLHPLLELGQFVLVRPVLFSSPPFLLLGIVAFKPASVDAPAMTFATVTTVVPAA
jgi:hypothetical protein